MTDITPPVYISSVYSTEVHYVNFLGEKKTKTVSFALDPVALLTNISNLDAYEKESANRAQRRAGVEVGLSQAGSIDLIRELASQAAGYASEDGENWDRDYDFRDSVAGAAFLTYLGTSEEARFEFAENVFIKPFEAFVEFAKANPSNSPAEIKVLDDNLQALRGAFTKGSTETLEERKARLKAELARVEAE